MDELSSTEFRKSFARLTEPVLVTVHGHVIGEWVPVSHSRYLTLQEVKASTADVKASAQAVAAERFNSQPFTGPIPKVKPRG